MKRRIKLAIFDLDGTLVNAYRAVEESVNLTLRQLGYPPKSVATIKRTVGWGEVHLLGSFVDKKDLQRALVIYRRHHPAALARGTTLLPGARRILKFLKGNNYRIAVASNRATRFTRLILRHLEIVAYFDYVLCRDRVKRPKPYPDIVRGILRHFALQPGQAVFVGDMGVDIQAGKRAGVRTVAVTTGSNSRAELKKLKPDHLIPRIEQLKGILNGLS